MFSIIILYVSGSMAGDYSELIDMKNKIITNQMLNEKNEGTVIFFASRAKTIIDKQYQILNLDKIHEANVGGGTVFKLGFDEASKYLDYGKNFDLKRVLFLTDGEDYQYNEIENTCNQMKDLGYKLYIIGFRNGEFLKN